MPKDTLPIDDTVVVPASVKRAAEAATAAHKLAYPQPDPQTPTPPVPPVEPPAPPVEPPVPPVEPPAPPVTPPAPPVEPKTQGEPSGEVNWEHRYHSMKGRFDQAMTTIGSMQQQMQELGDELVRAQNTPARRPQEPQAPQQLITDDDIKTYGPELLDLIKRAAREGLAPDLQSVQQRTREVSQRVIKQSAIGLYEYLNSEVPKWKEININPRFKQWLRQPEIYSGEVRGKLLDAAFRAANAPTVAAFFKGFLTEEVATGNAPADPPIEPQSPAPRVAAVPLETLTAPGRAKPAAGSTALPAEKPVITRAQVAQFYANVRKGAYAGRDQDKAADEQVIFAAQRDGRIR